jgi:RHS repeat-associated protein
LVRLHAGLSSRALRKDQPEHYPSGERYGKTNLNTGSGEVYVPRFGEVVTDYARTGGPSNISITPMNTYVGGLGLNSKNVRIASSGTRRHLIGDQVGTVGMTLDDTGAAVDVSVKDPWGVQLAGSTSEPYGALAQGKTDSESGLVLFGRRMYDPNLGRWTQTDPILRNRPHAHYTYANNRPISMVDPLGLRAWEIAEVLEVGTSGMSSDDAWDTYVAYALSKSGVERDVSQQAYKRAIELSKSGNRSVAGAAVVGGIEGLGSTAKMIFPSEAGRAGATAVENETVRLGNVYNTFREGGHSVPVAAAGTAGMAINDIGPTTNSFHAGSGLDTDRLMATGDFTPTLTPLQRTGQGIGAFNKATTAFAVAAGVAGAPVVAESSGASGFQYVGYPLATKAEARLSLQGMNLPEAQANAAASAVKAMTTSGSASIVRGNGGDIILRIGRAGRNGWQDMEYIITPEGKKTVMQFGYNQNLGQEHFDPKVLEPYAEPQ